MALFSSRKPLYFLFAGEGDAVFLDNMLQMSPTAYIWMQLRESGYENIYMVGTSGKKFAVSALDPNSVKQYNDNRGTIFKRPEMTSVPVVLDGDGTRKWVGKALSAPAKQRTAIVFSLMAMYALYRPHDAASSLDGLIDRVDSPHSILIRAPMRLREEHISALVDRDGIFGHISGKGKPLCEELYKLITNDQAVPLTSTLKNGLGMQFVELGAITYARLQTLMRNVSFFRNESWSDDLLRKYTNVLYSWWYYGEIDWKTAPPVSFQRACGKLFPGLRKAENIYAALYSELVSPSGWDEFKRFAEMVLANAQRGRKEMLEFLYSLDHSMVEGKSHVTIANDHLFDIAHIDWPEERYAAAVQFNAMLGISSRLDWTLMQKSLLEPYNKELPKQRFGFLEGYRSAFETAMQHQDFDTICRSINAMLFGGKYLYERGDYFDFDKRYSQYASYLECSKSYFDVLMHYRKAGPTVMETGVNMANQAQIAAYEKKLAAMDSLMGVSPELSKHVNEDDLASMLLEMEQVTAEAAEEETEYTPLTIEGVEMTPEEADRILKQKSWIG